MTGLWRYDTAGIVGDKYMVVRRDGTVPKWPAFVMGARDPYAPTGLRAYAHAVEIIATPPDDDYVRDILRLADEFDAYRSVHGTSDPEAPKHRTDHYAVLTAMKGYNSYVSVKPDK